MRCKEFCSRRNISTRAFGVGKNPHLPDEFKGLFKYWRTEACRLGQKALSKEDLIRGKVAMEKSMTSEKDALRRRRATEANLLRNPNHFSDMGKRAREMEPLEVKQKRIQKCLEPEVHARALSTTNSRLFKCLVTGFTSTADPLSRYQKARGIDTSLRERVHKDNDQTKSNGEN